MNKLKSLSSILKKMNLEKESREVLLSKVGYLISDMSRLKDYLTDTGGRALEVGELNRYALFDWLNENEPEALESISGWEEDPYGVDLSEIPHEVLWDYFSSGSWRERVDSVDHPTWDCMEYKDLVTDKWLIHFTYSAHDIASGGFKYGVDDLSRLCLTTQLGGDLKKGGGFNFAFSADDKRKLTQNYAERTGYGDEIVMFKANGIEVWHYGDEENQIIFKGSTARDIIPIWESDGLWWAGNFNKGFDSLESIVKWIQNNFDQYRRVLLTK